MGLWDSITGIAGDALGQWVTGENQKSRAKKAWQREQSASATAFDRSYGAYKSRYQDTMADMRNAGLNPIMAASGGFQVGNSVTYPKASAPMAQSPNYTFSSSAKDWTAAEKNTAETEKAKAQTEKIRQEAKKAIAETYLARAKKGLVKQQERETVKRILVLEKEIWVKRALFQKTMKESYKLVTERKLLIKKVTALKWQMEKLKDMSAVYKNPGGQVLAYIQAIMGSFGSLLGGGIVPKLIK